MYKRQEKDKPTGGLSEGDVAPDFKIESTSNGQPAFKLGNLKGKYAVSYTHLCSFERRYSLPELKRQRTVRWQQSLLQHCGDTRG